MSLNEGYRSYDLSEVQAEGPVSPPVSSYHDAISELPISALTKREKFILEPFSQRPNIAIPVAEVVEWAYGNVSSVSINTLQAAIGRMRKKIGRETLPCQQGTYHLRLEKEGVSIDDLSVYDPISYNGITLGSNNQLVIGDGQPPNNTVHVLTDLQADLLRLLMNTDLQENGSVPNTVLVSILFSYYINPALMLDHTIRGLRVKGKLKIEKREERVRLLDANPL